MAAWWSRTSRNSSKKCSVGRSACTRKGIEIDDDTELYVDEQQYYIHDSRDFHYEYESDIDLG